MFQVGDTIVVFDEARQMVANIKDPVAQKAATSWPGAESMPTSDGILVQFPWTEEACRFLCNIGIDATTASPLMYAADIPLVEGRFRPLQHQLMTAAFLTLYPRCYVLSEPRLGKTGSLILGMDYMQRHRILTGGVLILTTFTTLYGVWETAIRETIPKALVRVVHGPSRASALQEPADFYVSNYESVRLDELAFRKAVTEGRIGAVVIDELTHVGNPDAKRSKAIWNLCNKTGVSRVVGVTGSPADDPIAVYGMARVVNPGKLPCATKGGWKDLVTYQWGTERWQRDVRACAGDIIHKVMQPAIRFRKADVLDLPPVTEQIRTCTLTAAQRRLCDELRQEALTILDSGEVITAANGGVLLQRLMQVFLGAIKGPDGGPVFIDHAPRTQVLLEAIEETPRKTVVFCSYLAGIRMLRKEIAEAGYTVEHIDGSVTGQERARILHDFQHTPAPHILVCHPTTVGFGTELSAADTMIFANPLLLGGFTYNQALERLSSVKQTASNINIIHIIGSPEERKALRHLQKGHVMAQTIAGLFEDFARHRD